MTSRHCGSCKKDKPSSNFVKTSRFCKLCRTRKAAKYRVNSTYVYQPPKLVKITGEQEKITTYQDAADTIKITKNYLYVAISRGLKVNGYTIEKC